MLGRHYSPGKFPAEWTPGPVWTRRKEEKYPPLRHPGSNLGRLPRSQAAFLLSYLARTHTNTHTHTHVRALAYIIIIRVFCPRAGPSLQVQEPRLQFCRRQVFHHKLRNQGCCFTRDWIGSVASRCFLKPALSLAYEQTLKDSRVTNLEVRRVDLANWALNSIRVFDQIRNPNHPLSRNIYHVLIMKFVAMENGRTPNKTFPRFIPQESHMERPDANSWLI